MTYKEFLAHEAFSASRLICCASFERRSLSIPNLVEPEIVKGVWVLHNIENNQLVGPALKAIQERFGKTAQDIGVYASDPIKTHDSLTKLVRDLAADPPGNLIVDISTMMRETMLILLDLLRQFVDGYENIWIIYNSATYPQDESSGGRPWLSFDVIEVRSVLGYAGQFQLTGDRHLVLLPGFELSRAEGVIYAKDPALLSIGVDAAGSSTSTRSGDLSREFADDLKSRHGAGVREFSIYPGNADLTAEAITAEIKTVDLGKPVLCAMNTKVSTCGAAIAAWRNPMIELVYAQPAIYNYGDYSVPKEEVFVFNLPKV